MTRSFLNNKLLTAFFCSFLLIVFAPNTKAQEVITENQPLSFGEFALTDFTTPTRLRIRNNGNYTTQGPVVVLVAPTRGEYTLSNGTPGANYTITTPTSITLTGPGSNFTMDNIRVRPNTLRFNGAGVDNIRVAADLLTPGGASSYGDGSYTGTLDLTIAY